MDLPAAAGAVLDRLGALPGPAFRARRTENVLARPVRPAWRARSHRGAWDLRRREHLAPARVLRWCPVVDRGTISPCQVSLGLDNPIHPGTAASMWDESRSTAPLLSCRWD